MSDRGDLILEMLRAIRGDIAELRADIVELKQRDDDAPQAKHTPAEAAARIRELRKGNALPEGETIKSLIAHGRA